MPAALAATMICNNKTTILFLALTICVAACIGAPENADRTELASTTSTTTTGTCECTQTYHDGRAVSVDSCSDTADQCCADYVDVNSDNASECIDTCKCECPTQTTTTDTLGTYLRGVPVFWQHLIPNSSWLCKSEVYTGCGAVAAASLVSWFSNELGYDNLAPNHRTGADKLKWKDLVVELRDDYLNSQCVPFGHRQTSTSGKKMRAGLESYFADAGLDANVTYWRVQDDEMDAAFADIRTSINEHRPVVMVYCADDEKCEGIGITDTAVSDWTNAHIGLITGYHRDGGRDYVYVNTGWGSDESNKTYLWARGNGKVRLVFADLITAPHGDAVCAAGDASNQFVPYSDDNNYVQYTAGESSMSGYPTVEEIVPGTSCDVVGGTSTTITGAYDRSTYTCMPDVQVDPDTIDLNDPIIPIP